MFVLFDCICFLEQLASISIPCFLSKGVAYGPQGPVFKLRINIFDLNLAHETNINAQNGPQLKIVAYPCLDLNHVD